MGLLSHSLISWSCPFLCLVLAQASCSLVWTCLLTGFIVSSLFLAPVSCPSLSEKPHSHHAHTMPFSWTPGFLDSLAQNTPYTFPFPYHISPKNLILFKIVLFL